MFEEPRILPAVIDGKKSCRSTFARLLFLVCSKALLAVLLPDTNPCTDRGGS